MKTSPYRSGSTGLPAPDRRRAVARVPAARLSPSPALKRLAQAVPDLTLEDLLTDPLVLQLMHRDGVGPEDTRAAFRAGLECC